MSKEQTWEQCWHIASDVVVEEQYHDGGTQNAGQWDHILWAVMSKKLGSIESEELKESHF